MLRAMGMTKTFKHEDYDLLCSAKALDNGSFAPILVICKQTWPSRPRTIAMRCDEGLTEEAAIDSAHRQGIEWVANYG
jgi:hypothetical protein